MLIVSSTYTGATAFGAYNMATITLRLAKLDMRLCITIHTTSFEGTSRLLTDAL